MPDFQAELVRALPGTLREHSVRRGGKTAYRDACRAVTYRVLEERTGRLAGHLARLGVRRGDRVAVHLGNRVEVVEACLGVLRAAAVGVMLNTGAAESELAHFLDDSGASVVITEVELLPLVLPLVSTRPGTRVVAVGHGVATRDGIDFEDLAGTDPGCPPRDDLGLDDPAWILYTSGTTGESKGVVSTQRSALWSVAAAYVPAYGLGERDQLLWPLPMFHCYAHSLCLLGVVSVGAGAYPLERGGNVAEALGAGLTEEPFTMVAGVPATYRLLLEALRRTPAAVPSSLRVCVTAGAQCPAELKAEIGQVLGVPLLDGYGSTETCGKIAVDRLDRRLRQAERAGPRRPRARGAERCPVRTAAGRPNGWPAGDRRLEGGRVGLARPGAHTQPHTRAGPARGERPTRRAHPAGPLPQGLRDRRRGLGHAPAGDRVPRCAVLRQ
ncbi:long-chain fatty acid--CoA ligase [Streptomyces collinus]|uniref:long-chain fatty acid--CoA ligase n=1 Tax=Streptomyces collinus TaxID=42684 RepID=UPI00331CEF5B